MWKWIVIALGALILIFVGVVAMQPDELRVERSMTMAAPVEDVFAQVNNLRNWDAWSPWAKIDPDAKVEFEGPEAGEGAAFTWAGNSEVGKGKMTIVDSKPDQLVRARVDMIEPFEDTSFTEFTFEPDGNATGVNWGMSGQHNFLQKAMCLVMNGKKMLGDQLEKGLSNLKSVVEATN